MRFGTAATMTVALSLLPLCAGCSSSSASQGASTLPVKGKVMFKGQPLKKGTITFEPDGAGKDASGQIQPDGTFVMTTYTKDDGAVVGTHRVAIAHAGRSVPLKFASVSASKIEVEVTEGKTDYTIELK
ncbi:hypothetical protein ACYOEI_11460 [Singulisphaera rosea]